jgi:SDR family mycofactocin-dependent oxidoreductase
VAFITGVARGQGRSHAVRLAEEGADIIGVDLLEPVPTMSYPMGTPDDLAETVRLVEATGRRIIARQADVRDRQSIDTVVAEGTSAFGRLDIVSANAGICPPLAELWEIDPVAWDDVFAVNVTGVFHTVAACVPSMLDFGNGGSIVLTSSGAGLKGIRNLGGYNASKHAVIGMALTLANELARRNIRVNALCPATVGTPMVTDNPDQLAFFRPDLEHPTLEDCLPAFRRSAPMGHEWIDAVDVSNALVFLASDEARYVTGTVLPVDQGSSNRP